MNRSHVYSVLRIKQAQSHHVEWPSVLYFWYWGTSHAWSIVLVDVLHSKGECEMERPRAVLITLCRMGLLNYQSASAERTKYITDRYIVHAVAQRVDNYMCLPLYDPLECL